MTTVLEITETYGAAAWCGRLLVNAGFDVTAAPGGREHEDASAAFLDRGKRVIAAARGEVDDFDVVVTDLPPREVERLGLFGAGAPVVVSITPYGLSGHYRDWKATDATLLAHGGHTHLMGDQGRPPLTMPGRYPSYQAGSFAFVAAAAALLEGSRSRVEISMLECLATLHQFTDTMLTEAGRVRRRHGNRWANLHPITLLPCADGWFGLNILDAFWEPFTGMLGRPDLLDPHPWARNANRLREAEAVNEMIVESLGARTKRELFMEGQEKWRVPIGELQSLAEIVADPHLAAREFWNAEGDVKVPGPPYRVHTNTTSARDNARPDRPLEGIRVLDLSHFWSAPLCARILADLGADVIKVEAPNTRGGFAIRSTPEAMELPPGQRPWNRDGLWNKLNRNRRSLAVDLKTEKGKEVFLRLADGADVVIENFSARALPSLGLGHEDLRRRNPRLVYLAMPGFGLTGPYRDFVALGPSTEPMIGLTALMGYSDEEPRVTSTAVLDPMAGMLAAVAVMDALLRRKETGAGALVEVSQHECGLQFVGEQLVERQLTGTEPSREGNRHRSFSPHGVYPCAGDDDWIAIAVHDDGEWQALRSLADLAVADRTDHQTVDDALSSFTKSHDKVELARLLQSHGIAAAAVLAADEWLAEPDLEARGYFSELASADQEPRRSDGLPLVVNGARDYSEWRRAPMLGEHNREILGELGYVRVEVDALEADRVVVDEPPPA